MYIRCGSLRRPGLYVVHIAAEMAPIAKVWIVKDLQEARSKCSMQKFDFLHFAEYILHTPSSVLNLPGILTPSGGD